MKRCLLPLIIICLAQTLCAQAPLVKMWDKRFGGTEEEQLTSFQQTTDGGYILGGLSKSGTSGDKTQNSQGVEDFWIVKIDSFGNKQWDRTFGGNFPDYLNSLQQTTDGGYILGGASMSGISGDKTQDSWGSWDYWVVKIDSLGNKQWDKRFGGAYNDYLNSLQQTTDSGYILGGYSSSEISGDKTQDSWGSWDYWVVKIDVLGNKQWDKRFGGLQEDQLYSLQQTSDGGYILGGSSTSELSGDKTQTNWDTTLRTPDYWVVKIDSLGNKQWDKRFGGTGWDVPRSLQQITDGGYILGGISGSEISGDKTQPLWAPYKNDMWVVKIDAMGNKQWDKRFGGTDNEDEFGNISQTSDGGFLIAGTSYSDISGDKTEDNPFPLGNEQTWIVKTNSMGDKQWDKTIFTTAHDEIGYAIQANGCYIIANYTQASIGGYKTQPNWEVLPTVPSNDFWIVKFCDTTFALCGSLNLTTNSVTAHVTCLGANDGAAKAVASGGTPPYTFLWSDGQADDSPTDLSAGAHAVTVTDANGCTASTSINIGEGIEPCVGIQDNSFNNITLHPNPTNNTMVLKGIPSLGEMESLTLTLVDALGKEVWQQIVFADTLKAGVQLSLKEQEQGIYFLSIRTAQGAKVMKVVKY